ncbi:hypothetical protein E2C01_029655 [Portunus trituberculatus]|uniref:Uncharacterized protein n=1 Tax=Portunus trituberculatus TaxID=210409 RepID=A0A5B7ESP1_PORTR|nr:hypothetical protein [Portunus trituberculatus]
MNYIRYTLTSWEMMEKYYTQAFASHSPAVSLIPLVPSPHPTPCKASPGVSLITADPTHQTGGNHHQPPPPRGTVISQTHLQTKADRPSSSVLLS